MASGKQKRQAQLDAQTKASTEQFNKAADMQLHASPVEEEMNKQALATLTHKGDYADLPGTNWAHGQVAALKNEQSEKNRGAYTMGAQYADPNLLAAMGSQEAAQAAQTDQLGFENAVQGAKENAQSMGMNLAGLQASRQGSVLGPSGNMATSFSKQATDFAATPGFWSSLLLGGLGAAGNAVKFNVGHG